MRGDAVACRAVKDYRLVGWLVCLAPMRSTTAAQFLALFSMLLKS